jgi:hypothetical protein
MSSMIDGQGPIAVLRGQDLNAAANTDVAITIPNGSRKWTPRMIVFTNASANLSGGSLSYGFYTAVAEGGTAIVTKGVNSATSLTASTKMVKPTLAAAATADVLTASTIYLHIDVANGTAATGDFYIYGDFLP